MITETKVIETSEGLKVVKQKSTPTRIAKAQALNAIEGMFYELEHKVDGWDEFTYKEREAIEVQIQKLHRRLLKTINP